MLGPASSNAPPYANRPTISKIYKNRALGPDLHPPPPVCCVADIPPLLHPFRAPRRWPLGTGYVFTITNSMHPTPYATTYTKHPDKTRRLFFIPICRPVSSFVVSVFSAVVKKKRKVRKERTEREENLSHSDFRAWRNETRFDELSPLGLACSSEPHVLKAYCKFYGVDLYFRLSSRERTKKTASFFTTRKTRKVYRCIRKCIFCLCALHLELSLAFYKIRRFVKS